MYSGCVSNCSRCVCVVMLACSRAHAHKHGRTRTHTPARTHAHTQVVLIKQEKVAALTDADARIALEDPPTYVITA